MLREIGSKAYPIWLLGDSNPVNWSAQLKAPLDPRHPARHNIWTPIIDEIQDRLFRERRKRIDSREAYIRNAIEDAGKKPKPGMGVWDASVDREVVSLGALLELHKPPVLITFGAFSYEFSRRALKQSPIYPHGYWGAEALGLAFRGAIGSMDLNRVNVLPMLHATIARGRFIQSHDLFCGDEGANYFENVGQCIADFLINELRPVGAL